MVVTPHFNAVSATIAPLIRHQLCASARFFDAFHARHDSDRGASLGGAAAARTCALDVSGKKRARGGARHGVIAKLSSMSANEANGTLLRIGADDGFVSKPNYCSATLRATNPVNIR
jgi:hypothetical protein